MAAWDTHRRLGRRHHSAQHLRRQHDHHVCTIKTARSVMDSVHASGDDSVIKCIVFYPYTAQNANELSMMENEELEVFLAFSEGDGWVKARNYKGKEDYMPENHIPGPSRRR
ncbi:protein nervous wreck-like [Daphnia pulicaria]|uniref:protein nervous wreck-like n=1 Tax=Daphnia pulicaria TaxID=35523 RepID=UPI001EEC8602|nr:protein nervous wreck-like [Daphnia pulicaria]